MGYNLKTSYFELGELDKGSGIATISTIFGSTNNSLQGHNTEVDKSIVDLKLGSSSSVDIQQGLINSFKDHRASLMNPFPSTVGGSSKRARTPSTGPQAVSCLVDGCNSDLSKCRDYHRRHKVCEMHSKTPRVTIGGHEQRFCQQCSRFHSLGEFDEGKRSCRKRLEGHNRRRRKPQPEALPANHGNFPSANQGHRFLGLSNQPTMIPTANSVVSGNTTWSGAIKNECNNPVPYSSSVSGSYYHAYRGSQFPFSSQTSDSSFTGASSAGQMFHHDPNSASGNGGNNNNGAVKLFCNNGMNQVIHTDRALSLLSSSPADTREMELGRVIHPSPIGPSQPVISGLHYNSMGQYLGSQSQGLEGQPGNSALISNLRSNINSSLCQDVFQQEVDGSSSSGGHQTLSFSWE